MKITKLCASSILSLLFLTSNAFASVAYVTTDGGFNVYESEDGDYWFKLHGTAKIDGTVFIDDYSARQDEFPSGAIVRAAEAEFEGGIGKNLSYDITFSFDSGGVGVNDAFFTYSFNKRTALSIGQVISAFCLENANSGKYIPFLERSLPVIALRPCNGIGINFVNWGDHHYIQFASTTPPHGTNRDTATIRHRSDRLTNTLRGIYVPINCKDRVFQFGGSFVYAENSPTFRDDTFNNDGRRFSTRPEAKARNTPALVDSGNALGIKYYTEYGAEVAGMYGPFYAQAEALLANVNRPDSPNLSFYGWYAQMAYVLTGESRQYKPHKASFSGVKPKCKYGAWEVAARYSMVDLNDEDLHGGKENNIALSLGWYVNTNLLIRANYIYAVIDPTQALGAARNPRPNKRHLNIFAARAQIAW